MPEITHADQVEDLLREAEEILVDAEDIAEDADTAEEAFRIYVDACKEVISTGLLSGYVERFLNDPAFDELSESLAPPTENSAALWGQVEMMMSANGLTTEEKRLEYVLEGLRSWFQNKLDILDAMWDAL